MSAVPVVVYFSYADPRGFSGQRAATEMIVAGLTSRGWACRRLPLPVRQRGARDGVLEFLRYAVALLWAWARSLRLLFARGARLHVNLGQTRAAFVRDAVPLICGSIGLGRSRVTISLHGSLFMRWPGSSLDARVFAWLLRRAGTVTVLGPRQQARLIQLGIEPDRAVVLSNTCELAPLGADALAAKLAAARSRPVRLLHLGALIDAKGFPEFVEAVAELAGVPGPAFEAVLCGKAAASEFAERFADAAAAEAWIESRVARINADGRVRISWIQGAAGEAKAALFREADVFVLPTRYPVEAQPIVLLEAMASGCAIITTRAGEIEAMVDEAGAVFLPDPTVGTLAGEIARLVADAGAREELARAGWRRFNACYQRERHLDRWEAIFIPDRHG